MIKPVQTTFNSHLSAGFLTNPQSSDLRNGSHFFVKPGKCLYIPENPFIEAVKAAKLIRKSFKNNTLWLALSGGVDSECMAQAFIAAQINFCVAICRFKGGYNDFDIQYAISFCKKNKISYQIFELDIFKFYENNEHLKYGKKYGCNSPQLTAHMKFIESVPGAVVCAWNPPCLRLCNSKISVVLPTDRYIAFDRFYRDKHIPGTYFFFLYTAELFYSFLRMSLYQDIFFKKTSNSHRLLSIDDYVFKCKVYTDSGFTISPRKAKYTGFEKIKEFYGKLHQREQDPVYEELFRYPLQQIRPDPIDVIVSLDPESIKNETNKK